MRMGRTKGAVNTSHEATREGLLVVLADHVVAAPEEVPSLRQWALVAGVNVNTLRHYFGTLEALLGEVFRTLHKRGEPMLLAAAINVPSSISESVEQFLRYVVIGWQSGVAAIHVVGLRAGLLDEVLGPVYIDVVLEPLLKTCEARLARHIADGALPACNLRHAALALVGPLLLALLHQGPRSLPTS
jgi:AcrR family transcriptional regulator